LPWDENKNAIWQDYHIPTFNFPAIKVNKEFTVTNKRKIW